MNTLIIIRGPLGVGKTTIAKLLAEKLFLEYISVDETLDQLHLDTTDGIPVEHFLKVNSVIAENIQQFKIPTIVDGNFYYQEQLDDLTSQFPNDHQIITLISDIDTCVKRDAEREKSYGVNSVRFVYEMTTKIQTGFELDTTQLSKEEATVKIITLISQQSTKLSP